MVILLDGSVPVCREDLHRKHLLGNILTEDAETIWSRGNDLLLKHKERKYPGICEKCDEYYTYNF